MKALSPHLFLFVSALLSVVQANAYSSSPQAEDLALQYAQTRCGEIQAGSADIRPSNKDALYCQYLQEMLVSPCSKTSTCVDYGAWVSRLNPAISPNDRGFNELLKQRAVDFRNSLHPRKR